MPSNFLEQLLSEWYMYNGYFVRNNVHVGKLAKGGYEGELDILAYHPEENKVVHIEASMDALSWQMREDKYVKKFKSGKKYIPKLFPYEGLKIEQVVVLGYGPKSREGRETLGGGQLRTLYEVFDEIIQELGKTSSYSSAVPQEYSLLRAIQFTLEYGNITLDKHTKD